jgi:hypothetical protein
MLKEQHAEKERELWHHLVERELVYIQTRQDFLNNCTDRMAFIKKALHNSTERGTALRLIEYLKIEERQILFNDLVDLASVSHSDIEICRQAILTLADYLQRRVLDSTPLPKIVRKQFAAALFLSVAELTVNAYLINNGALWNHNN